MLPRFAPAHVSHGGCADAKLLGYDALAPWITPYHRYLFCGEHSLSLPFTMSKTARTSAVFDVGGMRILPDVVRVNAKSIVALMACFHAALYLSA